MSERNGRRRRWRPQSRAAGCLLWIVVLLAVLLLLSVLFGGFQKGTKVGSAPGSVPGQRMYSAAQELAFGRVAALG